MPKKRFFEKDVLDIIDLYVNHKLSCFEIAIIYKSGRSAINRLLKQNGVKFRQQIHTPYNVNHNFFDVIDTEGKAYFLGWMFSDGNVSKERDRIRLGVAEEDKYILEIFIQRLEFDGFVSPTKNRNIRWQNFFEVKITSKQLKNRLIELGCVPAKSLIVEFPKREIFQNDTLRHFLRGYFDGNGSIVVYPANQQNTVTISGGKNIIFSYKNILEKYFDLENVSYNPPKALRCAYIAMSKLSNIQKFYDFCYTDATLFLTRKKDKFDTIPGLTKISLPLAA